MVFIGRPDRGFGEFLITMWCDWQRIKPTTPWVEWTWKNAHFDARFVRQPKQHFRAEEISSFHILVCVQCNVSCGDIQHLCSIEHQLYAYCISLQMLRVCIPLMQRLGHEFISSDFLLHGNVHCPADKRFQHKPDDSLPSVACISDCVERGYLNSWCQIDSREPLDVSADERVCVYLSVRLDKVRIGRMSKMSWVINNWLNSNAKTSEHMLSMQCIDSCPMATDTDTFCEWHISWSVCIEHEPFALVC